MRYITYVLQTVTYVRPSLSIKIGFSAFVARRGDRGDLIDDLVVRCADDG